MPLERAWQVQQAKQRLSEVLRAAERGQPQVITRHGTGVAVVIDMASYRRLTGAEIEFVDFLQHGPGFDDLVLERSDDVARVPDLGAD